MTSTPLNRLSVQRTDDGWGAWDTPNARFVAEFDTKEEAEAYCEANPGLIRKKSQGYFSSPSQSGDWWTAEEAEDGRTPLDAVWVESEEGGY